jgi:hypothetical protein
MSALARRLVKIALRVVAVVYLAGVWLNGAGIPLTARFLPKTFDYFLYVAALFPIASSAASEYRAEAWVCADDKWREIDVRPYFQVHADDKESRFQRSLFFYHDNRPTKIKLDAYIVDAHNRGTAEDEIPVGKKIGGVRFLVVRVPIPSVGSIERYRRRPLAEVPREERSSFYQTPAAKIRDRCGTEAPPAPPSESPESPDDASASTGTGEDGGED